MKQYLPILVVLALFAAPAVWMMQGAASKTRPDADVAGCYANPEFGEIAIADGALSYRGETVFPQFLLTEAQGPLEIHGQPHYAVYRRAGGLLDFVLVKDGYSARHIVPVREEGGKRALDVRTQPGDEDVVFTQAPCTGEG